MWGDLAVPVVVAIAATYLSRWAVPGRARRVSQAKAEAELLQLMPEGSARAALQAKLEVDVLQHVSLEKDRKFNAWFRTAVVVVIAQALALGTASYALLAVGGDDNPPAALEWVAVVAIVLAVVCQLVYQFMRRRLRVMTQETHEVAEEQVHAAAIARLDLFGHAGGQAGGGPAGEAHLDLGGSAG